MLLLFQRTKAVSLGGWGLVTKAYLFTITMIERRREGFVKQSLLHFHVISNLNSVVRIQLKLSLNLYFCVALSTKVKATLSTGSHPAMAL